MIILLIPIVLIPIIWFSDWKLNLIIYGPIITIIAVYVWHEQRNYGSKKSKSTKEEKEIVLERESETISHSKECEITTEPFFRNRISYIDDMRAFLVDEYFRGNQNISFKTTMKITPETVLDLINNKKYFPFHNSYTCNVSSFESSVNVKITVSYSQGFKLFLALFNYDFETTLNNNEIKVLLKIRDLANCIVNPAMNSFEKAKVVHDYLISTSHYDYENYIKDSIPEVSRTPYGLLFEHKAVCQAYAETYMLFMIILGIECHMVVGALNDSPNKKNDNHSWNIIKIDGKYGHVDVTSDNPHPKSFGKPSQKYFFITDDIMDRTHTWKVNQYPFCN